jgi:hypothetical protein
MQQQQLINKSRLPRQATIMANDRNWYRLSHQPAPDCLPMAQDVRV